MDLIKFFIDLFLHLDVHLAEIISQYGLWTYALLFFVIFMETGFVVTPFLPGDSLLFAAGTFAALGALHHVSLLGLLAVAAILATRSITGLGTSLGNALSLVRSSGSRKNTLIVHMLSSRSTAARRSSWPASYRSSAPSRLSWPGWGRCATSDSFLITSSEGSPG